MKRAAPAAFSAVDGKLGDSGAATAPAAVPAQDLSRHHAPLLSDLHAAALRVLDSGRFILGAAAPSEVRAFESELAATLGVSHAVGVSSGTDALLAMLMAAGVGPGDQVVTTPFSFFATAGAIARVGARPHFVDVEPATLTLQPEAAAAAASATAVRAVLTVHLFGRAARCGPVAEVCAARGIPLLEDAAQAIGATDPAGRPVGALGQGAALSFFPSKNLGGFGDGGMVVTNDDAFAAGVRLLRTHGATDRVHHTVVGGNFRLDELQAALLRVKLPRLTAWTAARRGLAAAYGAALAALPVGLPPVDPGAVWNQYVIRVPDGRRDDLAAFLAANGVASAVYYRLPLHLQPCFAALGYRRGDLPVAERAADEVLALPLFPELTAGEVGRVAETIGRFFAGAGSASPSLAAR